MNANISEFVICVEAIIYLLSYNLYDCTFNEKLLTYIFISMFLLMKKENVHQI